MKAYNQRIDDQAKELGAIQKMEFNNWDKSFIFYLLDKNKNSYGYYKIYKFIPMVNGGGNWQITIGDSEWVDRSTIIETYKRGNL